MTDRDRLIELFEAVEKDPAITCPHYKTNKTCDTCKYTINNYLCNHTERTVDYLIANGVIVPPCKVGNSIYEIVKGKIIERKVEKLNVWRSGSIDICYPWKGGGYVCKTAADIGKTVFLTKEEAEEKLKELKNNAR